jgi:hypothetical protein
MVLNLDRFKYHRRPDTRADHVVASRAAVANDRGTARWCGELCRRRVVNDQM